MKGMVWDDSTQGMTYQEVPIPADMVDEVNEWRQHLVEAVAEYDDKLLEKFFDDPNSITENEMHEAIRKAVIDISIIPMMCGSSFKNKGVQTALDAICRYLPGPLDIEAVKGTNPDNGEELIRKADAKEPFAALAFKIMTDPFVGRLAFFRAYSGHLDAGSYVLNTRTGKKERISRIMQMHANKQNPIDFIEAGDIGAGVGFKDIKTGDTLCDENHPIVLEAMTFPEPVISIAVEPKTQADTDKMGMALAKLAEEDPTFKVKTDEETGQTIISGMGELHLEIIVDRMKREFGVEANVGAPQVAYRETITKTVTDVQGKHAKQSGGKGQYGDCTITLEPSGEGNGYKFIDEIKGGVIPREFIPSVDKGIRNSLNNGILAGFPVVDVTVRLTFGSYHDVDSSQIAFELAGSIAFKEAMRRAGPCILEPMMAVEVETPEEYMGDVMGDLNRRRGIVQGMDDDGLGGKKIKAEVPLAEMFGYSTDLRSATQGRATYSMEFKHYSEAPKHIAEAVMAAKK